MEFGVVRFNEMKKYIGAMKLAGSEHIAKTYEAHLKKLIEENS